MVSGVLGRFGGLKRFQVRFSVLRSGFTVFQGISGDRWRVYGVSSMFHVVSRCSSRTS